MSSNFIQFFSHPGNFKDISITQNKFPNIFYKYNQNNYHIYILYTELSIYLFFYKEYYKEN